MDYNKLKKNFEKCKEPIAFAQRYHFFKATTKLQTTEEIFETLHAIEQLNLLGALYILVLKELDYANEYIRLFWERNHNQITSDLYTNSEHSYLSMQMIYLCMMHMEDSASLAETVFSDDPPSAETGKAASDYYAQLFLEAIRQFPAEINWKRDYCRIIMEIFSARKQDSEFVRYIETGLGKTHLGNEFNIDSARKYFDLLCSLQLFDCATHFLENFGVVQQVLDFEPEHLLQTLFSLPSPELVTYGKWYKTNVLNPDYSYADWHADVLRYNTDPELRNWMNLAFFYHRLKEHCESKDWTAFDATLSTAGEYRLFNLNHFKYIKQLIFCFAYVIDALLDSHKNIVEFLNKIEHININTFYRNKFSFQWNQILQEKYDYNRIKTELFEQYEPGEAVFIYMNTHLKCIINLEEIIHICATKAKRKDISEFFNAYPISGRISHGSKYSSVRDKLFISPQFIATALSYPDYVQTCEALGASSPEAKRSLKRQIRNDESWYSKNKFTAELFRSGDWCSFHIHTYVESGDRAGIYAVDINLYDDIRDMRIQERDTIYPGIVLDWLKAQQTSGSYIFWNPDNPVYGVNHLSDNAVRNRIALEILDTILVLRNNPDALRDFLFAFTNAPLEELNEFRYIPTQHSLNYSFPSEDFDQLRRQLREKALCILKDNSIPSGIKKDIYLNTCLRKYFDFQDVCRYISKEFYLATADEPFSIALKLEKKEGEKYIFTTQGRKNTLYSSVPFVYYGEAPGLKEGQIYLNTLRNYDFERRCFILEATDLRNHEVDIWNQYLRKMRDIKKITDVSDTAKIKDALERYNIRITSDKHISQFTHELNLIFQRGGFDIRHALTTLSVIAATNPYLHREMDFSRFQNIFRKDYLDSYKRFMESFRTKQYSYTNMCDLFFSSHFQVFISKEEFLSELVHGGANQEDILNYCNYKAYPLA